MTSSIAFEPAPRYDALIIGARCAGAATAMLLARSGLRTLAIDRDTYGSDTLSTLALMRGGVLQLRRWGLLDRVTAAGTPAIRRTSFFYGGEIVTVPIKARDGVDALYAPRRTVLDPLLVDAAREAGAAVLFGARLASLRRSADGRVTGAVIEGRDGRSHAIDAGIVIGADGAASAVARHANAPTSRSARHASGVVYGFWAGLGIDGYQWHYRPGVSAGVIPTNEGLTCVFAGTSSARFLEGVRPDLESGYHRVLREVTPSLGAAVAEARRVGPLHGFAARLGFLRRSWGPGWALVGDAGYFKDPITAHGITDALRDAELLARAVVRGGDTALARYETVRNGLSEGLFEVTDEIASFAWDLSAVQSLHRRLSDEMSREVKALSAIEREEEAA
jgi:2-polyprenyl-6-methoxyphenol hydroxylase-like FAD-dependent oxidoreductase